MVEIADIKDRESLRDWLEGQSKEVSVWIAHRNAMRVLPLWWDFVQQPANAPTGDLMALPVLCSTLISGVAGARPTPEIKSVASANASSSLGTSFAGASSTAALAAAQPSANGPSFSTAASASTAGSISTAFLSSAFWELIREDCEAIASGDDLDRLRLWGRQENPFADVWATVKTQLVVSNLSRSDGAVDWSFWIKWYDDALAGNPPNWDMLERIALIDPDEWDKGAERVNELIAEIQLRYELKEQISVLEAKLQSASSEVRGMGDNQGPPLDEAVAKELLVVWEPLQELKQEVEDDEPSKSRVLESARKLGALAITIGKWAAGKADKFVDAFASSAGKVAGTAAIGFGITWYTQEADTVAGILSKIAEIAGKWAGYLP